MSEENGGSGAQANPPGHPYQQQHQQGGRWNRGGGYRGNGGFRGGGNNRGGQNYGRGGNNQGWGGQNRGRGGQNQGWGGQNQGWGQQNQEFGGQNQWSSGNSFNRNNANDGYFNPSMLRDPWEELEREIGQLKQNMSEHSDWDDSITVKDETERAMSDSLIPQVGDTLLERNANLDRSDEEPNENEDSKESSLDQEDADLASE
jgi:hypothetical protein